MLFTDRDIQKVSNDVMNMLHDDEVEVINELHDALVAKDIEKIDELLKQVISEMEVHFKTEEDMMADANYPNLGMHKSDHDFIRAKLEKFAKRWDILKSPSELKGFFDKEFKRWYTQHITKWDTQTAIALD
ncbi:MAG TPA: bacteriohemerythrin [Arcobacter sp.]|jgi:hemerythrin|nr:bacteriohemerythrin [Arcobacter sp.]